MSKELNWPVWLCMGLPDCWPLSLLLLDDGSSLSPCSDSLAMPCRPRVVTPYRVCTHEISKLRLQTESLGRSR